MKWGKLGIKASMMVFVRTQHRIATSDHLEQRMEDNFTTALALKESSQSGFMGKLGQICLICKGLASRVHAFTVLNVS